MARKAAHTEPVEAAGPREAPIDYHDDRWVEVYPEPALASDTARVLLAAAANLGYDAPRAVISIGGGFRVPADVLDATDLPTEATDTGHTSVTTPLDAIAAESVLVDGTDAGS